MKKRFAKLLTSTLLLAGIIGFIGAIDFNGVKAETNANSITVGSMEKVGSEYKLPVTVSGALLTYSVTVSSGKLKLTSISGNGYTFKNGVVDSKTSHSTPEIGQEYVSVQLVVTSNNAAQTALETIRYQNITSSSTIEISGDTAALQTGDYYFGGHYYTVSTHGNKSWKDNMEWAFNLWKDSSPRYNGYKSYPVVIDTKEENQMLVNVWNSDPKHKYIFLPAVPAEYATGTNIVASVDGNGLISITVTGEPHTKTTPDKGCHDGTYFRWLQFDYEKKQQVTSTALPSGADYWESGNPDYGGMVYFGHPSAGAYWDDLSQGKDWSATGDNIWTGTICSSTFGGRFVGLAEWESNGDTSASAKWTGAQFTVTFDNQGVGTAPSSQNIAFEGTVTKPNDPTADGNIFLGWFKEKACTTAWDFNNDKVMSNVTLYAKWVDYSFETHSVGGFYLDSNSKKVPLASFGFELKSNKLTELYELLSDDGFGVYVYSSKSATGTPTKDFHTCKKASLISNSGRFYVIYDSGSDNTTYYAKGFITVNGANYYSDVIQATTNTNGSKYNNVK